MEKWEAINKTYKYTDLTNNNRDNETLSVTGIHRLSTNYRNHFIEGQHRFCSP